MIRHITGKYLFYEKGSIVVETQGGIGFRIHVADTSPVLNAREGDVVQLYTYMQVKDDGMSLFGFNDRDALTLFEQLLTVNGVGPKAGLAIMSIGTVNQIKAFIMHKDAKSIAKAQGVGKKTAERVILELADKVSAVPIQDAEIATESAVLFSDERNNAVVALTTLGYSKAEAEEAIGHVPEDDLTIEEYIKKSLKFLM
ncbi:MAG: Holliday junction branch migration protein RuvA [Clostridia bacterium]|uniref:Holliday junction branch migration complex subunit RuvA n=1 Tax=Mogibacterium kristiansenii TaxID=2606708 RepID=A0A6N7XES8_9FIRM|nr:MULTISPECIES: Holliday junction branch migration protein RuvA [Mogibacterium]MDY5450202.1 Holliday junction branch migration protein RuvA [Clostridia bacterium]MBN2935366.1 Holliday junction branch migration protein RuvA [Mogibacterium sp.]MCI7124209.1 Holliday junction branch migration protein RuvA [Mogibacterium sp.]MDD6699491.1 Holliday junction branch migration protein RuvA [Mogibacterium kristiansenii]MEE0369878.1 Holliday junction branch migration protein RuvA [Clostridia bacterium]